MIKLQNLSCGYGKKVVLNHVDTTIKQGELTCLLGKNGTGKTTLFKTIMGLLPPISGAVFYNNTKINSLSNSEVARLISYVPQAHGTPFPFSVLDVVLMGQFVHTAGFMRKPGKRNIKIACECLMALGIDNLATKDFKKLSGGQKQMVLIARAMAQQPKYIAMDEPTANLDLGNSIKVMNVARKLKEQGYGVIMNTHSPEQALEYADKVVMLKNGGVANVGKPGKVLQSDTLTDLYSTPVELVEAYTSKGEYRKLLVTI